MCGNPQLTTLFSGLYLRNRSTLDIGVLGYMGIFLHKEHPPEVFYIPPWTPCIFMWSDIKNSYIFEHMFIVIVKINA
jgi:hypothetical protein